MNDGCSKFASMQKKNAQELNSENERHIFKA